MRQKLSHMALTVTVSIFMTAFTIDSANAAIVFDANFDGTTAGDFGGTIGYGAQITGVNLNAGTSTGTWTVNTAQAAPNARSGKMIQTDGGADVPEKALRFGIATDGVGGANTPVLTANLSGHLGLSNPITVSFDYGIISFDSGTRTTYLTGRDGSANRLFQVGFVNSGAVKQMGYFDSAGTWTLIGSAGDLIGNNNTYWDASLMKNVTIEVGATTYDIKLNDLTLSGGSGIAFRDVSATGLDTMEFSASTKWTGGAFDNMSVTQVPEPTSASLLTLLGLAAIARRRLNG